MNVNLHCMVPQRYLFRTVNYIFILYIKLVIIKRNKEHLSLHRIHPLYAPFMYTHKLSPSPLQVRPNTFTHVSSFSRDIYNDDHCIWSESTIRTLDFRIHSLWSAFTFCGYYTVTGSPYNFVFSQDTTS